MKLRHLLFILIVWCSCNRQTPPNHTLNAGVIMEDSCAYYPIKNNRIPVNLDHPQKVSLFDYFKHIELIPLETNDTILIGRLEKIIEHQNRYYIFDGHRTQLCVKVFDESGKFSHKIGKKGQGPGEYSYIEDVFINPFTGNIELLQPFGRIYTYDLSGKYVMTSHTITNDTLRAINRFIAISENIFVFFSFGNSPSITYYNMAAKRILFQAYENHSVTMPVTAFFNYHGQWYFHGRFDNMVYELGPTSLTESYRWDFGKYNYEANHGFTAEIRNDSKALAEAALILPYWMIMQGQNNRYVMAQISVKYENRVHPLQQDSERAYLIYDKSKDECKFIKQFTELVEFLRITSVMNLTNEYLLSFCEHGELAKFVNADMLDENNRKKYNDLINEKTEMNPILIKYYFK